MELVGKDEPAVPVLDGFKGEEIAVGCNVRSVGQIDLMAVGERRQSAVPSPDGDVGIDTVLPVQTPRLSRDNGVVKRYHGIALHEAILRHLRHDVVASDHPEHTAQENIPRHRPKNETAA